jgi:hypothetical protein
MLKTNSPEIEIVESAHPYAMLDNDLPTMMSLVYQLLAKDGITPKQPLFVSYSDDEPGKPKGKRARQKSNSNMKKSHS